MNDKEISSLKQIIKDKELIILRQQNKIAEAANFCSAFGNELEALTEAGEPIDGNKVCGQFKMLFLHLKSEAPPSEIDRIDNANAYAKKHGFNLNFK